MLPHSFLPKQPAGRGLETVGHARVGNDEKIVAFNNRRRNIGRAFRGAPYDVRLRHVAFAVRPEGEDVMIREAAGNIDQAGLRAVNR